MGLNKKVTYKYIKELLNSEIKVVKDIKSFDVLISVEDLELDNVVLNTVTESIIVHNAVRYKDKFDHLIQENLDLINSLTELYESTQSDRYITDTKLKIEKIKEENKVYETTMQKMEEIYTTCYSLARDGLQDTAEEVVFISHIVTSEKLKMRRELISRPLQFTINKSDYSAEINLVDIFRLEIDMFPIEGFEMYGEVKEIGNRLNVDSITDDIDSILNLLKVSFNDIKYDGEFSQIIKRKRNLFSTIEDYQSIIDVIEDDEILDEHIELDTSDVNGGFTINENELYLPLPANDQQKEIAQRLTKGSVAVQGPPGTGKTHTIINIISHMLALGKTILVVSEKMDALNVIHEKMPKELQSLVMPMLGGALETRKLTEDSIKNIINRTDSLSVSQELQLVNSLKEKKIRLHEELSQTINKQIDTYVVENEDLELYGERHKLSDWMKNINIDHIQLDDCETAEITIDRHQIIQLLNYDKELLNNIIKKYISSSFLLTKEQYNDIIDFTKQFNNLDIFTLESLNLDSIKISQAKNFDNLFLHWYLNETDYELDKANINTYQELSMKKTKFQRDLVDNIVIIPESVTLKDLKNLINKAKASTGLINRLTLGFAKNIIINGEKFWDNEENITVLEQYYQNQINLNEFKKLQSRFTSEAYFGIELSSIEMEEICTYFENMRQLDTELRKNGVEFIIEKHRNSAYNLTDNYETLFRTINSVKKLAKLKVEIEDKLDSYDEMALDFNNIVKAPENSLDKYLKFYDEVIDREKKYADSQNILTIKAGIDNVSKSLYSKLVSGECDETILDYWQENYIYSQVNKVARTDFKIEIERLRKEIDSTNVEIVEKLAWLELMKNIGSAEKEAMQTWITLINKIGKGTGKRAPELREKAKVQMDKIKHSIPVWITTRSQVADLFKFSNIDKFDLVIYDESSQSTITALNVLERGHRKLIVGDDKQISPSSFISHDKVEKIRNNYFDKNEDVIIMHDTTLYDFAVAKYSTVNLREHFRCLPEIIKFSNDLQYNGSMVPLRTVNSRDKLEPVIESVFIETGFLTNDKTNQPEAEAIVERIKLLVNDQNYADKSIGVISLLGDKQDRLISRLMYDQIGTNIIDKHNIKVSNSSAFQGDERDVILLSLVTARKENEDYARPKALTKTDDYKRYNVAASRAKDKMILFHSIRNIEINNKECARFKLLEFFENFDVKTQRYDQALKKFDSIFEEEIFVALNNKGYNVIPQYDSNGFKIDLVVEAIEGKLAIECDGERYHGRDQFESDFKRQAILERAGWTFYRIRGRDYFANKQETIQTLLKYLEENELYPYLQDNNE